MNPNPWVIILAIIAWCLLFAGVYTLGMHILKSNRKNAIKRRGQEIEDYEHEKRMFRFYVIAFFVGIPILFIIGCLQEFYS